MSLRPLGDSAYRVLFFVEVIDHQLAEQIRALLLADPDLHIAVAPRHGIDRAQWQASGLDDFADRLSTFEPSRSSSRLRLAELVGYLARSVRRGSFDLIDTHMAFSLEGRLTYWIAKLRRLPYTLHLYGKERNYLTPGGMREVERRRLERTIRAARLLFCHDRTLVETAHAIYGPHAPVYLLYNATRLDRADARFDTAAIRARLGIEQDAPVVLYNHRVMEFKRPLEYVLALAELRDEFPEARFLFVGPRRQGSAIGRAVQQRISELGLERQVVWVDRRVSGSEMEELYAISDVAVNISELVVPSLATLEAISFGLPTVVADALDTELYVRDGVNGVVVPPDPPRVAAALRRLLSDPDLRREMGAASRRHAREHFDIAQWADRVTRSYRHVVKGEPLPPPQSFDPMH